MRGDIVFYICGSMVECDGVLFSAGELTADTLNLTPEEHRDFFGRMKEMKALAGQYEQSLDRVVWWELNNAFDSLRRSMMEHTVFQRILRTDEQFLNETRQYTQFYSLLPEEELDYDGYSIEELAAMSEQSEAGDIPLPLLIFPGSRKEKWQFYKSQLERYDRLLGEVAAFNQTIQNFIGFILSKLQHNSPEEYARALHFLYNDERMVEKLIVNPWSMGQPFYQKYDECMISYVPRELPNGTFAISQEHTTDSLQMLLKADYMTALNAGYNIHKCIVCGKYFLVKGGAHTLYCEGACPHAPQYTCRQFGTYEIQKELVRDIPKVRYKVAALERIRQDRRRKIITEEEAKKASGYVTDLLYRALREADFSNEQFEDMVASEKLYDACGVVRRARPRGRPRKNREVEE